MINVKVEKVEAYRSDDGELFSDVYTATQHQLKLDIRKVYEAWADKYLYSGMLSSDVVDILCEHGDELIDALS